MHKQSKNLILLILLGFLLILPTISADPTCPFGKYTKTANCDTDCSAATAQADCDKCNGWYLPTAANSKCSSCRALYGLGCSACDGTKCTSCDNGKLPANKCADMTCSAKVPSCSICDSDTSCYLCNGLTDTSIYDSATKLCSKGTCTVAYCLTCDAAKCVACANGYTLKNDICQPVCSQSCTSCFSPTQCLTCAAGLTLTNGKCVKKATIANCVVHEVNGICTSCATGYTVTNQGALCQKICSVSNCIKCDADITKCTTCSAGFKLNADGTCTKDALGCSINYCSQCESATTCKTCAANTLIAGDKKSCGQACIANCQFCDSDKICRFCASKFVPGFDENKQITSCTALTCGVTDCTTCLTATTCQTCKAGYKRSADYSTCTLLCDDPNCSSCKSATECQTCNNGYTLNADTKKCQSVCKPGYWTNPDVTGTPCTLCSSLIPNCDVCFTTTGSKVLTCKSCSPGYYSSGKSCLSCSAGVLKDKCIRCQSPSSCDTCSSGFTPVNGVCTAVATKCNSKYCDVCADPNVCTDCKTGFYLDTNGLCQMKSFTTVLSLRDVLLKCPTGTYASTNNLKADGSYDTKLAPTCIACADSNCIQCTINTCITCLSGFFADSNKCTACIANCAECQDATTCKTCKSSYSYVNKACTLLANNAGRFTSDGAATPVIYSCEPGCEVCSLTASGIVQCDKTSTIYSRVAGKLITCDSTCKTCSTASVCTSCYFGYVLSNGACLQCSGTNVKSCWANDVSFTTECEAGFIATLNTAVTPTLTTCSACAANCLKCDLTGASKCDTGKCAVGYVQTSTASTVCTACENNCPVCNPEKLSECLSCGSRKYKDTKGVCLTCPYGCKDCVSATECTTCANGYVLSNKLCVLGTTWPCLAGSNLNGTTSCTSCAKGFTLSNKTCVFDTACNALKKCSVCPYGQYLSTSNLEVGQCLACPTLPANCITCDPDTPAKCLLCTAGYFQSSGACVACAAGCAVCTSATFCTVAASGYYSLTNSDDSLTGVVNTCVSPCLTCDLNSNFCLTCIKGYSLSGTTCKSHTVTNCTLEKGYYYTNSECILCSSITDNLICSNLCTGYAVVSIGTAGPLCTSCVNAYKLYCLTCTPSECSTCATGYTLSTDKKSCKDSLCSIDNCITCKDNKTCSTCSKGFALINNACTATTCTVDFCSVCDKTDCVDCVTGYKLSSGACVPVCNSFCNNCTAPGQCNSCTTGYVLSGNDTCYMTSCTANCFTCATPTICSVCKSGYVPFYNGTVCMSTYSCADINCLVCPKSNATCTICNTGYKLVSGACTRDICSIMFCTNCVTASTCDACATDYVPSADKTSCVPSCQATVANCLVCTGSTCNTCKVGYTLSANNLTCTLSCTITKCDTCYTGTTCLACASGYALSSDSTTCNILCGDANCKTCSSATACATCNSGFSLNNSTKKCEAPCRPGFSLNTLTSKCTLCAASIDNCEKCANGPNGGLPYCTSCTEGYYLSYGKCFICNNGSLSNCLRCSSPLYCNACMNGYMLNQTTRLCVSINCVVKNCYHCITNTTFCDACMKGFTPDANGACIMSFTKGQSVVSGTLACPPGSYLAIQNDNICLPCVDHNCAICTINNCQACKFGYFAKGPSCVPCIAGCLQCQDQTTCSQCQPFYTYANGACKLLGDSAIVTTDSTGTNTYACDVGCGACSLGVSNAIICDRVLPGYSMALGKIIKCDPNCQSCTSVSTFCTECFFGYGLSSNKCIKCSDPNAGSCAPGDASFSLTCTLGYNAAINIYTSPTSSTCQPCAANCYKCDIYGPGTCDPSQCFPGYVQTTGNKNCTICFNGCSTCSAVDLTCLSCGVRRYNESGTCLPCPAGCLDCTSATVCTSCATGFNLVGTLCQAGGKLPCLSSTTTNVTNSNGTITYTTTCTKCIAGYTIVSGSCSFDTTCNSGNTCTTCPNGQYLTLFNNTQTGSCTACPSLPANCLTCSPSTPANCLICNNGYYVSQTNTCVACSTGCAICTSANYCTRAKDGYFLPTLPIGLISGQALPCTEPCLTCDLNSNLCLSCVSGYSISGSTCFSSTQLKYTMTFNYDTLFGANDTYNVAHAKTLSQIGLLKTTICSNLPSKFKTDDPTCRKAFNIAAFRSGSIAMDLLVSANGYTYINDAAKDLNNAVLVPGSTVISSGVVTATGTYYGNGQDTANIGLILGLAIPLGIILIIILGVIIFYKGEGDKYEANAKAQDSNKHIHQDPDGKKW